MIGKVHAPAKRLALVDRAGALPPAARSCAPAPLEVETPQFSWSGPNRSIDLAVRRYPLHLSRYVFLRRRALRRAKPQAPP